MCCKDKLPLFFPPKYYVSFARVLNCYQYTEFVSENKEKNPTNISGVS